MAGRKLSHYSRWFLVAIYSFLWTRKSSAQPSAQPQPPAPAAREITSPRPNSSIVPSAGLSLADRHALMYLYSRLDQTYHARAVAEDVLREFPGDKPTLELLFSLYLDNHQTALAQQVAQRWIRHHPKDPEAHASLARVLQNDGQPAAASEILQRLREQHPPGKPFPYEEDLATAAQKSGDWPQAIQSYQNLLSSGQLSAQMQSDVRQQLDQLYRAHLPQASVRASYVSPRSGTILRTAIEGSVPVGDHYRLAARMDRDDLAVKRADFLADIDNDRYDILAGLQLERFPWQFQFWAGGSSQGPLFRASAARTLRDDATVSLVLTANHRAMDSLLLEALDGREDKISFLWSTTFGNWTYLDLQLQGRRVSLSGHTLGYGYLASANLSRTLIASWPELRLGYRGLVTGFSREATDPSLVDDVADPASLPIDRFLLLDNLVQPINLHGLFVTWEHEFNPRWRFRVDAGADYSFERSDVGYSSEAGVSFFPSKSLELLLEGGYSTSAETSNAESELVQLSLALRYFF